MSATARTADDRTSADRWFVPPEVATEPDAPGVYRDRDGDIWVRVPHGWVLCLQGGVAVDTATVWQWTAGHVRDYAPFALVAP
ncbi:hypothetical protein ACTD5D_16280 [Nocardia takedensis]|uniref:hypothetical protein n=1 Tax=Nocardia takedensis TaxID=259390 RepID=UPI0002DDAFDF|nr:hypothetical protein [Nocardia takedensis]